MNVIGEGLRESIEQVQDLAKHDRPVLIFGATGTGKELVAREYGKAWAEKKRVTFEANYRVVNCAHFRGDLLRSELFGYVKGAFTGATADRTGVLGANVGVICLDEFGDSSDECQASLLRLVESGEYMPVGGDKTLQWPGRLIGSTNKPDGIRKDLRFRFHEVWLPSLLERALDIVDIVEDLANEKGMKGFTETFVVWAVFHNWKGNVRELLKVIEKAQLKGILDTPVAELLGTGYPPNLLPAEGVIDIEKFRSVFLKYWEVAEEVRWGGPMKEYYAPPPPISVKDRPDPRPAKPKDGARNAQPGDQRCYNDLRRELRSNVDEPELKPRVERLLRESGSLAEAARRVKMPAGTFRIKVLDLGIKPTAILPARRPRKRNTQDSQ